MAVLTNTSLVTFLPASGLWAWYRRSKTGKRSLAGVALSAAFFFATIAPWLVRNYQTFGKFIFIRSNFGAELRLGNGPGADGTWMSYLHPTQNALALKQYEDMGEIAYVAERKHQAMDFIRADYARFAWLSFKRFVYYWGGGHGRPRFRHWWIIPHFWLRQFSPSGGWGELCANASLVPGCFSGSYSAIPPSTTSSIRTRAIAIPLSP